MPNAFGSDFPRNETPALSVGPEARAAAFEERWRHGGLFFLGAFGDLIFSELANQLAAGFVRAKIRETVRDPQVARLLEPQQVIGCKRLCLDSGYYVRQVSVDEGS